MRADITLIHPKSPFLITDAVFPPLGIMYLATALKQAGFHTQCLDMGIGHSPEMAEANIIGISFSTAQRMEAYSLVNYYRQRHRPPIIIAGGPHATHMPMECLRHGFDMVIKNEADHTLIGVVKYLKAGGVKELIGDVISSKPIEDIDALPIPDRSFLPIKDYKYDINGFQAAAIMTSRGCPYNCSFCARLPNEFRQQSSARTVSEILHLKEVYGYKAFMVFDDVFVADRRRLYEVSHAVAPMGLTFRCLGRANLLTPEVCAMLKLMNVVEVGIGVESGSEKILRKNLKKTTPDMNSMALRNLREVGIRTKAFLIVGLPGETEETVSETRRWLSENKPDDMDASIFQPLPGSSIFNEPHLWDIKFDYEANPSWYKGKPGEYKTTVQTEGLSSERIIRLRDELEHDFKRKENLK